MPQMNAKPPDTLPLTIRPALRKDLKAIAALYREIFEVMATLDPEHFQRASQDKTFIRQKIQNPNADFLLAIKQDHTSEPPREEVIGFALIAERTTPPYNAFVPLRYGYIMDLVIAEEYRHQGVGTALIAEAKAWCRERLIERLQLSVLANNEAAKALYKKEGFAPHMMSLEVKL